jgi:diguanylate cyclase (GGDEF)-like protein/PAS domain S-box-containing protein
MRVLPVLVIALGLIAIASITALQQRTAASHHAELRLADAVSQLNKLQNEPFDAGPEVGTDPLVVRNRIQSGMRRIRGALTELGAKSPPRELTEVSAPLRSNFAQLLAIYRLFASGHGQDNGGKLADRLSADGDRHGVTARRLLVRAADEYRNRGARSQRQATAGSAAVIVILLVAFGLLYRRSSRARSEVERSEERFRALVANVPGAVFRRDVDADWTMQFISDRIAEICGYRASQFVSGERSWADLVASDDRERIPGGLGVTDGGTFSAEYAITHADGGPRWVHERGEVVRDADGAIVCLDGVISDITELKELERERARMERRLRHQASHDELTGLPNRALFEERVDRALSRAARADRGVAVLFIDLDDFKIVNDTLGHAAGDDLLREVATRLRSSTRQHDTAARLGGDEFAILAEGVSSREEATTLVERLVAELGAPYVVADSQINPAASVGIALGDGHADDTGTLLRNADVAMYYAKRQGSGAFAFFDSSMFGAALHRA